MLSGSDSYFFKSIRGIQKWNGLITLIGELWSSDWERVLFKGHILVHLPEMEGDFLSLYRKVKKEITNYVKAHFHILVEEVLFEIRSGAWNCSFKLDKTLIP